MTQRRPGDGFYLEPLRHDEAQLEHAGAGDLHTEIHEQYAAILTQRQALVAGHSDVRLDRRGLQRHRSSDAGVTVGAAHGQPGELVTQRVGDRCGKILEVDRRHAVHAGAVQLNLGTGRHPDGADLTSDILHAQHAQRLLIRERGGCLLRAHAELDHTLLRRGKLDLQCLRLGIKPP